jgi:hypothetical protein
MLCLQKSRCFGRQALLERDLVSPEIRLNREKTVVKTSKLDLKTHPDLVRPTRTMLDFVPG